MPAFAPKALRRVRRNFSGGGSHANGARVGESYSGRPFFGKDMKIATWNVNGIRARQAQLQEWVEREQPDVVCLQEIKAVPEQIPATLWEMEGYWCYWHGTKGYSGVGLHVRKAFSPDAARVRSSGVRLRVPDRDRHGPGGDLRIYICAERRQGFSFEDALSRGAAAVHGGSAGGRHSGPSCAAT